MSQSAKNSSQVLPFPAADAAVARDRNIEENNNITTLINQSSNNNSSSSLSLQLTGLWYVIEMFRTGSHCMTLTFARTTEGFTGTEVRELAAGRAIGLDHSVSNTGVFNIRSMDYPAVMKVRWPSGVCVRVFVPNCQN